MSDNMRGALLMMASMAAFTINDALLKSISDALPLFQILFLRGLFCSALLLIWVQSNGALRQGVAKPDRKLIALRVAAEVGAAYFFLTALFNMPLANVTAILQALPLTISMSAALFLGEPLGWRRMGAIAVGFIGVLLIVKPGTDAFDFYSIYALIAVGCVTVRDLITRKFSGQTPSLLITLSTALGVGVAFGFAGIGQEWGAVDRFTGTMIFASAAVILLAYLCSVLVMRVGEVSFVAPFRYSGLLWALMLGYFIFGDVPDRMTLVGSVIVVTSGVFLLYREAIAKARA